VTYLHSYSNVVVLRGIIQVLSFVFLNVLCTAVKIVLPMACFACVTVCASDKRIACDEEFSDSEDEGDGRRHRENFKHKRPRIDEKTDSKAPPSGIDWLRFVLHCYQHFKLLLKLQNRLLPFPYAALL
jgi:hypothetical protein